MDDTISRQAALDALNRIEISRNASWYEFYQKALTVVGTLPSALPSATDTNVPVKQPGWIPCKDRLPSFDFTDVLVCMHDVRHGCKDEYYIASAYVVRGHWEMTLNVDTSDLEIVAWMELPKPWKGGEK